MSDRFKDAARIAAAELGIEKTPEEWDRLIARWVNDWRAANPGKSASMSDAEVFTQVVENARAQKEKSEENLRSFEEFIRDAPTSARAEKFVREMIATVFTNCPMELLIRLAKVTVEFRRSEMNPPKESP